MKIFFGLLLTCFIVTATAARADHYLVGIEANDYLPFWKAQGADFSGFGREFFDMFAKYSGNSFTFRALPIKRCLNSLLYGKVDAKFPSNVYWDKETKVGHKIIYSKPIVPYTDGVLVLPANKGKGKAALRSLSTMIGFTPWVYEDDIKSGRINLSENTNMLSALKKAISGRADGVYFNPIAAKFLLKTNGLGENSLVFDPDLPHTDSEYRITTTNHPELIKEINQFLIDKKTEIDALKKRYGLN